LFNLLGVVHNLLRNREDDNLSGGHPNGPLSTDMLCEDREESLNRSENSSMDDNGSSVTGLEVLLLPSEHFGIILISREVKE